MNWPITISKSWSKDRKNFCTWNIYEWVRRILCSSPNKLQNQDIFSRVYHKLQQHSFEPKLLLVVWFSTQTKSNAKKVGVHKRQDQTDVFILKCYCFSIFKTIIMLDMCKLWVMYFTAETKHTVQNRTSNWNWIDRYILLQWYCRKFWCFNITLFFSQEYCFLGRG